MGHADSRYLAAGTRPQFARVPMRHLGAHRSGPNDRGRRPAMENPMNATAITAGLCDPVEVSLHDVEQELSRQLRGLAEAEHGPMQRVRMSNLVVYCDP